jgi:hypothetical protein
MFRNKFIYSEYERSLLFILSNTTGVPALGACLLFIIDYVGNEKSSKLKFTQNQIKLINEDAFFNNYILLVSPPNTGKTALLHSIKTFSSHCIQFDFDEIVANTLDGLLNCFRSMLIKEASQHRISLNIEHDPLEKDTLLEAYQEFLQKLYAKGKKKIIIKIDNYDTPLLASYYYNYYHEMKHWFKKVFHANPSVHCHFILAGLARYSSFNYPNNVNIKSYYFNKDNLFHKDSLFFESKEPFSIGGIWIPELIQKNRVFLSTFKSSSFIFANFKCPYLNLDKIEADYNHFCKFLIYLGYFSSVEKVKDKPYLYKLQPHPTLLKIISKPIMGKKEFSFFASFAHLFSKKPFPIQPKPSYTFNPRFHFNFSNHNETKQSDGNTFSAEELKHPERFMYPNEKKHSCIIS